MWRRRFAVWLAIAFAGCGRLGFDAATDELGLPENGEVPSGELLTAARPDGTGFAVAWVSYQTDRVRVWRFAEMDASAQKITSSAVLFADRDFPLTGAQLVPVGENWLLMRQYEWDTTRMPVDLALIADDGTVIWEDEDNATWFAAAQVVPSSQGFGIFYHHHEVQSDSSSRRQVYSRHYDTAGGLVTGERDVIEVLDHQFLLSSTPTTEGALVVWREESSMGARFAVVSPTGTIVRDATIAGLNDIYWAPAAFMTSGGAVFVESNTSALAVRRVDTSGTAVWTPGEKNASLGLNRFQFRTTALAGDQTTTYVFWLSDEVTDLPVLRLAELDTSGAGPIIVERPALTDGSTSDFAPTLAVAATHLFAAWVREADGGRTIEVRVLPR